MILYFSLMFQLVSWSLNHNINIEQNQLVLVLSVLKKEALVYVHFDDFRSTFFVSSRRAFFMVNKVKISLLRSLLESQRYQTYCSFLSSRSYNFFLSFSNQSRGSYLSFQDCSEVQTLRAAFSLLLRQAFFIVFSILIAFYVTFQSVFSIFLTSTHNSSYFLSQISLFTSLIHKFLSLYSSANFLYLPSSCTSKRSSVDVTSLGSAIFDILVLSCRFSFYFLQLNRLFCQRAVLILWYGEFKVSFGYRTNIDYIEKIHKEID